MHADEQDRGARLAKSVFMGAVGGLGVAVLGVLAQQGRTDTATALPISVALQFSVGGAALMAAHVGLRRWSSGGIVRHYIGWLLSGMTAAGIFGAIEYSRSRDSIDLVPILFFGPVIGLGIAAVTPRNSPPSSIGALSRAAFRRSLRTL